MAAFMRDTARDLLLDDALKAIKLRAAAQALLDKRETSRMLPRAAQSSWSAQDFARKAASSADDIIADIEKNTSRHSRTQIEKLADYHFLESLNIDKAALEEGIRKTAPFEGLHSMTARVATLAASAASFGASALIPDCITGTGLGIAGKAIKKVIKFAGRNVPMLGTNPWTTGSLRMITNVAQQLRLTGGQPRLADNILRSRDMGAIGQDIERRTETLQKRNDEYIAARGGDGHESAFAAMVEAYLALHAVVNDEYKSRIGLNRSQTYSKAYGGAVNALAMAGAAVAVAAPGPGTVAGLAIQGACVPVQWAAGYGDEKTKHRYNLHANMKWGDYLTDEGKRLHFKDLKTEHIDTEKLRAAHMTYAQLRVAGIREVYSEGLGKRTAKLHRLEERIERGKCHGSAHERLSETATKLRADIEQAKRHIEMFESFDPVQWSAIPADSCLGRCLDDPARAEKALRKARFDKAGELQRQVLQRYDQALHSGLSMGLTGLASDTAGLFDGVPDATSQDVATALGAVGGAIFVSTTGEVRMTKDINGHRLTARAEHSPRDGRLEKDKHRWLFEAGGRTIDLRNTGAYDRLRHSRGQRFCRFVKAIPPSVVSGPKGVRDLVLAKLARRGARPVMQETLALLADTGLTPPQELDKRQGNFSAMKYTLLSQPDVSALAARIDQEEPRVRGPGADQTPMA